MQTNPQINTVADSRPASDIELRLSLPLIIIDDPLLPTMQDIKNKEQQEYLQTKRGRTLTKTSSLQTRPSCFKSKIAPSVSLPPRLQYHVHFSKELDSRWSNGSPKSSKPLLPIKRRKS